jgi:hypothetical protein
MEVSEKKTYIFGEEEEYFEIEKDSSRPDGIIFRIKETVDGETFFVSFYLLKRAITSIIGILEEFK